MSSKKRAIDRLRELRREGKTFADTYEVEDVQNVYDELSEDKYREHQRARLREDDFVVDDDGDGYVDNGAYEWDTRQVYSDDEEEDGRATRREAKKRKRDGKPDAAHQGGRDGNLAKMFRASTASAAANPMSKPATATPKAGSALLDGLINGLGAASTPRPAGSMPSVTLAGTSMRRPGVRPGAGSRPGSGIGGMGRAPAGAGSAMGTDTPVRRSLPGIGVHTTGLASNTPTPRPRFSAHGLSRPQSARIESPEPEELPADDSINDDDFSADIGADIIPQPALRPDTATLSSNAPQQSAGPPSSPPPDLHFSDLDDEDEEMASAGVLMAGDIESDAFNRTSSGASLPTPAQSSDSPEPVFAEELNLVTATSSSKRHLSAEEAAPDGVLSFYWMDHSEHPESGTLIVYGRTGVKSGNGSVALVVRDLFREVYFLKREGVAYEDAHAEIDSALRSEFSGFNVPLRFHPKLQSRKYCFGADGVPEEGEYILVHVPFSLPGSRLQNIKSGETFSHVFGTDASLFERFVLAFDIMGPCWLDVTNFKVEPPSTTQASITATVKAYPKSNIKLGDPKQDMPPVNMMSISLRTITNKVHKNQEVVAISARMFKGITHDTLRSAKELPSSLATRVRPIEDADLPKLKATLEMQNRQSKLRTLEIVKDEAALLRWLSDVIIDFDPDFLVGHNLENVTMNILLNRMNSIKVGNKMIAEFKILGRVSRRNTTGYDFRKVAQHVPGRLLVDLSNDMGKSLATKCDSWTLTEMAKLYLSHDRLERDIDLTGMQSTLQDAEKFIATLRFLEFDTFLISELALKLQIIALSKQLTTISGNAWSKTLAGSRIDRNEFILLHEFTRSGYIVPDKYKGKAEVTSNKAKFKGGLVLEPEKGLHTSKVLVMDFNSLYPSIIQEFNICFTTIDQTVLSQDEDALPELPRSGTALGLFPRLIKSLVDKRRSVKKLMKEPAVTKDDLARYDIRQQALKLTANSMYGCLGSQDSRFYALPLAKLTTSKGREILEQTRQLAMTENLKVVYGDTDSVMLDTNRDDYFEAIQMGEAFKKKVNARYRMLEIDIDNVFGRLLLHEKKKYAALNLTEKNGKVHSELTVKGLDMRRREFSNIAKEASEKVLNFMFDSPDHDVALADLYRYLEELGEGIRGGKFSVGKFIIRMRLGKDPSTYAESERKRLPHVAVAMRMREKGEIVSSGDVISFVVTHNDDPTLSVADRAMRPADANAGKLKLDYEHYLVHQILPPIQRIAQHLPGVDIVTVAQRLGIDITKHKIRPQSENDRSYSRFETKIPDAERFAHSKPLLLQCSCHDERGEPTRFEFRGLDDPTLSARGIECPNCHTVVQGIRLHGQIENQVRKYILQYYNAIVVFDDADAGSDETREIGVYGNRCQMPGGAGEYKDHELTTLRFKYSDRELFTQLSFFMKMFDYDSVDAQHERYVLAQQNKARFAPARKVVGKYLNNNGRRFVDMSSIFRFA